MSQLVVCPLSELERMVSDYQASHVLTVISPDMPVATPKPVAPENHLTLHFNDIAVSAPGMALADDADIEKMIGFIGSWDQRNPMIIHCWMGVSRSTASALTALALLQPDRDEREIAKELRFVAPFASPNRRIIHLADKALRRRGRLINAVETIGRGEDCFQGTPFTLPV